VRGAASLGFGLNILAFAVIKLTGSLTQKVLGTIKNVLLVVFSFFFMHEAITARQWIGYQVSLLGFVWYQHQKGTAANAKGIAATRTSSASRYSTSPGHQRRGKL
jgi:drug/metabolite transporter (DMT)-like permease